MFVSLFVSLLYMLVSLFVCVCVSVHYLLALGARAIEGIPLEKWDHHKADAALAQVPVLHHLFKTHTHAHAHAHTHTHTHAGASSLAQHIHKFVYAYGY